MTWLTCGAGPLLAPDPELVARWRSDSQPFHAVVVLLDGSDLRDRLDQAAGVLEPWIDRTPDPHVTVHVSGATLAAVKPRPLRVTIAGADSFASAAFLHADGDDLRLARREMLDALGPDVAPAERWVPHVTVGTYRSIPPVGVVADRLEGLRFLPPLDLIGTLSCVRVDRGTGRLRPASI